MRSSSRLRKFIFNNLFICFLFIAIPFSNSQKLAKILWSHASIDSVLDGSSWGTAAFTLADFDLDGDLDITISRREIEGGKVFWYQNNQREWKKNVVGVADENQLGAAVTDINNDGFPDLVVTRFWFQNPGNLIDSSDAPWIRHNFSTDLKYACHDLIAHDMNRDGRDEIICYSQRTGNGTLRAYFTNDPFNWSYIDISDSVNENVNHIKGSNGVHGGLSPAGAGDLDGDRLPDISMPCGWYRNPGRSGGQWLFNEWPFSYGIAPNLYGISSRMWIVDLDHDRDNDIVYMDCDVMGSKGYWIENQRKGTDFILHELPSPGDPTGSFHSLAVADFDNDGDQDIFSGEQEDPDKGMKSPGLKERGFFWENVGNKKEPAFMVRIIQTDNPGWHDVQAGDVDGDGDIDLVSKVWNKDGKYYHADFWENLTVK